MKKLIPSPALCVALAALVAASAGGAYAASSSTSTTTLFAQIEANGHVNTGTPGITSKYFGSGTYAINFHRDIERCAAIAGDASLPLYNTPDSSTGYTQGDAPVTTISSGAKGPTPIPGFPNRDTVIVSVFYGATANLGAFAITVTCR
jgi:hypothetical protein